MMKKRARDVRSGELSEIMAEGNPVLVDFYAPWCGQCKAIEPVIERFAERLAGRAQVIKVNIDLSPELAGEYSIRGVPTLLLFVDGLVVERVLGTIDEGSVAAMVDRYVSVGAADEPNRNPGRLFCVCTC